MDTSKYDYIRNLRSDSGKFPVEEEVNPIIIVWVDDNEIQAAYCKAGHDRAKRDMTAFIGELKEANKLFRVIGTWAGKWSTDTFKFDTDEFLGRLVGQGQGTA
jgi:hypothetical protein